MKKVLSLIIVLAILTQVCGCGVYEIMTEDRKQIDAMSEEIIRCLIDKDRDALEQLFCLQVRDTAEFDAQMNALYEFFDYDHVIRYDLDGNCAESESTEHGDREEWSVSAEIIYIEVSNEDTTRIYGMRYDWTQTYQKDASLVGLHSLSVYLLNSDESKTVGTDRYFPF